MDGSESTVAKLASATAAMPKPSAPAFRLPATPRILWSLVESSFSVESLLPMHIVVASMLITSMLSVTQGGYSWLWMVVIAKETVIWTGWYKSLVKCCVGLMQRSRAC